MSFKILKKPAGEEDILEQVDMRELVDYLEIEVVDDSGEELLCFCPFHESDGEPHTPSFSINIATTQWICRSQCGGGNAITLVAELRGVDNVEATKWLKEFVKAKKASEKSEPEEGQEEDDEVSSRIKKKLSRSKKGRKRRTSYWDIKRAVKGFDAWAHQVIFKLRREMQEELVDGLELEVQKASKILAEAGEISPREYWNLVTEDVANYLAFEMEWELELYRWLNTSLDRIRSYMWFYKNGEKESLKPVLRSLRVAPSKVMERVKELRKRHSLD